MINSLRHLGLLLLGFVLAVVSPRLAAATSVSEIEVLNSRTVNVLFSGPVGDSALIANNYTISGSGQGVLDQHPAFVSFLAADQVQLSWVEGNMKGGGRITITVANVLNSSGSPLVDPLEATLPNGAIGTPPELVNASAKAAIPATIEVTWNLPMAGIAGSVNTYDVSGQGLGSLTAKPDRVEVVSNTKYRLVWDTGEMVTGGAMAVTATGAEDDAGNPQNGPSAVIVSGNGLGEAPHVVLATPIDSQTIEVVFTEPMDLTAAFQNPLNFSISGTGRGTLALVPDKFTRVSDTTFRISWNAGEMRSPGDITVSCTAGADLVGNPLMDPKSATFTDPIVIAPTVTSATVDSASQITVKFSEDILPSSISRASFTVSGPGRGTLSPHPDEAIAHGGGNYQLRWNAPGVEMVNGAVVSMAVESTVADLAGNVIGQNATQLIGIGTPPTVLTSRPLPNARINYKSDAITLTFSEPMQPFTENGLVLFNGVPSVDVAPDVEPNTYFIFMPTVPDEGEITVTLLPQYFLDLAGNPIAPTSFSFTRDFTPPQMLITIPAANVFVKSLSEVWILFNEDVTVPSANALTVGGSPATESQMPLARFLLFRGFATPAADGPFVVSLAAGALTDAAGNLSPAISWTATLDTIAPSVQSTIPAKDSTVQALDTIGVVFDEPMIIQTVGSTGLLVNGTPYPYQSGAGTQGDPCLFAGPALADGSYVISIPPVNNGLTDRAGNGVVVSSWVVTVDSTAPTIISRSPAQDQLVNSLGTVSVTFGEPVTGVQASALSVGGALATNVTGTGAGPYEFSGFGVPFTDGTVALVLSGSAGVIDAAGNAFAGSSWTATLDRVAPTSVLSVPSANRAGTTQVQVNFTSADERSGITSTALYVRAPGAGGFVNSGLTLTSVSGTFTFTGATTSGRYEFAAVATDGAGNSEPPPTSAETSILLNTVADAPFTQTVVTGNDTLYFPMRDDLVVSLTLQGATPGGTITVSRQSPVRGSAPAFFLTPAHLLDERLTITSAGLGASFTAVLYWPFLTSNLPGEPMDRVWRFESPGDSAPGIFPVSPGISAGTPLRIAGITSFSQWYAGEQSAILSVGNALVLR